MTNPPTPPNEIPWSRRQFRYAVFAAFALQVGLVWFLADRPRPSQPTELFETRVRLVTAPWPPQAWENQNMPLLRDSALIPLPNQHGFSAQAWLRFSPLNHVPHSWTNSEQWLAPDAQNLGTAFQRLAADQGGMPVRPTGRSVLSPALPETVVPSLTPLDRSQLELEGELAGRKLRQAPALPSWPHSDILSNTVLQIMVQPDGWVFSATLLLPCGLPEADTFALAQARSTRFEPAPPPHTPGQGQESPWSFGRLVFRWHAQPPPPPDSAAETKS